MKKLLSLLLALVATTCLWAYDFQSGDLYYNITNDTVAPYTVEVTYQIHDGYVGHNYSRLTAVIIPETVTYNGTTYRVTSIGEVAFDGCSSLTSITIPESVTSIGEWAFSSCSSLTSITIPESVTSIGEWAFSYCSKLTSMVVKRGNTNYDSRDNCNAIIETATNTLVAGCQNTIIPNSTTSVAVGSFAGCSRLTSITIPNSVTSIRESAFRYCSSLVSVTIGNSVSSIEKGAFSQCPSITSIKVKTSNPIYDSRESCNAIIETKTNTLIVGCQNTTIPNTITSIGEWSFVECTSLNSIIIPNSVISIGKFAFWYCSSLTSVTIGNRVMTIGKSAFQDCDSLASLTIGNNVTVIEEAAFRNCFSLTSITIPNSVTSIGWGTFMECSALKSIIIPNNVTNIGNMAFWNCTSLDTITCLAMTPPALGENVFDGYNNTTLLVPCKALSDYQAHEQWGQFTTIECISSEEAETKEVVIESGTTTIIITWPTEEGADTYTIVIKKDGEVVCTLTFNSEGQLISIAFVPGRDGNHPAQYAETVDNGKGFRFTVTGLEDGTDYTYDITVKNEANQVIKTHSGKFTTEPYSAVDNTHSSSSATNPPKLFRNGQLLILRDGVEYTVMGQEM